MTKNQNLFKFIQLNSSFSIDDIDKYVFFGIKTYIKFSEFNIVSTYFVYIVNGK